MIVEDVWPKKGEFSICSGLDFCRTEVPKKKKKSYKSMMHVTAQAHFCPIQHRNKQKSTAVRNTMFSNSRPAVRTSPLALCAAVI